MAQKLVFDTLETKRQEIQITFDGINYEFYNVDSLKTNGLEIPDTCDNFDNIKIKNREDNEIGNFYYLLDDFSNTFYKNNKVTRIKINNTITSIRNWAFQDCSSLTSIEIPNSVTKIGTGAFRNCSNLTLITIPNSVTSIEPAAFFGCSNLMSIIIPNSVSSIGDGVFQQCYNLANIELSEDNRYFSIENQVLFNKNKTTLIIYFNFSSTSYEIPNSVTSIRESAFSYCSNLTSIVIPNSVTSITGNSAFGYCNLTNVIAPYHIIEGDYNLRNASYIVISDNPTIIELSECSNLVEFVIPNSVVTIGDYAFCKDKKLLSVTIPNSVTSIGNYAFLDCKSLTSITIPDSITSIGNQAFYNCSILATINYTGTMEQWNAITKGSNWNYNCPQNMVINYNYVE